MSSVAGTTLSPTVGYVLADIPAAPTTAPYSDPALTNTQQVRLLIDPVSSNGGTPITSYSLELDDGFGGSFVPLYGVAFPSFVTSYTKARGV